MAKPMVRSIPVRQLALTRSTSRRRTTLRQLSTTPSLATKTPFSRSRGEGVLGNDFDIDVPTDILTVVNPGEITTDLGATVVISADGKFTYDPRSSAALQSLAEGQSNVDRFRYTLSDGTTTSNEGTVRVTVSGRNDAPVAVNDSGFTVDEDSQLTVATSNSILLNDTDAEEPEVGSPIIGNLRSVRVSGPSNGSLDLNANGTFTYTPNPDFNGVDTFVYRANDGSTNSNPATVAITVLPINDAPTSSGDLYAVDQDTQLTVSGVDGVLRNDSDPDQQGSLKAVLLSTTSSGVLQFNVETALVNGVQTNLMNGSFTYTPNQFFVGTDTFTYRAVDEGGLTSSSATVVINVRDTNIFQNPVNSLDVNDDSFVSAIDALLLINDINENGSRPLTDPLPGIPFPDVNGDRSIGPVDVLGVINSLNGMTAQPEGEATAPAGLVRAVLDPAPPTFGVFGHNVVGQPESLITQSSRDDAPTADDEHKEFFGSLGTQQPVASEDRVLRATDAVVDSKDGDFTEAIDELFAESFDDLL